MCLFARAFLVLFCFVMKNKRVSVYALILRDGFQQIIAKALAANVTAACVRSAHKNHSHLYYREF